MNPNQTARSLPFVSARQPGRLSAVVLMLLTLLVWLALGSGVWAASITVNTAVDVIAQRRLCSLREAMIAADTDTASGALPGECAAGSGADVITLPAGTFTLTLTGAEVDYSHGCE